MIIQLSDYMLEQAVSDAEVSNIALEQAMAEIEVGVSLANAYSKQLMMEQYIMEEEATATETETKSEESGEKKSFGEKVKGFFKAIGKAIAGFFKMIWEKLGDFWNWITRNGKKAEEAVSEAAKSEEASEDLIEMINVTDNDILSVAKDEGSEINATLGEKAAIEAKKSAIFTLYNTEGARAYINGITEELHKLYEAMYNIQAATKIAPNSTQYYGADGEIVKPMTDAINHLIKFITDHRLTNKTKPKGTAQNAVKQMEEFVKFVNEKSTQDSIRAAREECNKLIDMFNGMFSSGDKNNPAFFEQKDKNGAFAHDGPVYGPLKQAVTDMRDASIHVKKQLAYIPKLTAAVADAANKYRAHKHSLASKNEMMKGSNKVGSDKSYENKSVESSAGNKQNEYKYTGGYEAKFV